jgi:hypothetical protein
VRLALEMHVFEDWPIDRKPFLYVMFETNRNGVVHGSQSLASVVTHFLKLIG